jgi:hypothetical protein
MDANLRLVPVTVLYLNKGARWEKNIEPFTVSGSNQGKISRSKREKKICKKIIDVTKNTCRIPKLQIGLTQLIAGAEERQ